jgi:hypothetical protein
VDWAINAKNHASFELNRMRWASPAGIQTQASNTFGVASFGNDFVKDTWGIAKLDTFITSALANEARFQYGRDFEYENSQPPTAYEQQHFVNTGNYVNPLGFPPDIFFSFNSLDIGTPTFLLRKSFPDERRTQFADTITWSHGNHNLKFGADYIHTHDLSENLRFQYGSYTYGSFVNYLSDLTNPNHCSVTTNGVTTTNNPCYSSFQQAFGPLGFQFNTNDIAFFGQDDWKISPRLTLNLALRWENEMLPSPFTNLVNPNVPQTGHLPSDTNNFGPHVGFAYDPIGKGKTVVRGGYGIYYGRIINSAVYNALITTGMPGGQASFTFRQTDKGAPVFPRLLTAAPGNSVGPNIVFFDHGFQAPQIHQTDLTLEQDLGWNSVASVSYLGSYGRQLPGFVDTNITPASKTLSYTVQGGGPLAAGTVITVPLYTSRLNSNFGAMTDIFSGVNSSYNALAIQFNHRMTHHVQFSTNYTWAHAIDYNQNEATFTDTNDLLDPYNLKLEKGNSIYDVPNRFVFNAIVESPWNVQGWKGYLANGWQLSPLFQAQSGLPFSMTTSGNPPSGTGFLTSGINGSGGRKGIPVVGRNTFKFPNTQVMDLRLSKHLVFQDRYNLELIGQAFNLFNHLNATSVNTLGYLTGGTATAPVLNFNPTFGTVTNGNSNFAYSTRQIELGMRLSF